ncbi:MAG TPA: helix-turn-helix domain-containing protein [Myxococcota bacterium]|nr:helix-turn-helix domain-containing protein [Myxococcota bacterium]
MSPPASRRRAAGRRDAGPRARRERRREPEEKRARLLAAARRLFAERGYAATTTADLAREAGMAEGTVFHHFGSKQALLAEVAAEYGRGLAVHMFGALAPGEGAPTAEAMLRRAFSYVRDHGAVSRLLALAPDPTDWAAARGASRREIVSALAAAFERWSERGLLRRHDPALAAELLFALVESALTACFVREDGSREEAWLRETVACVEGALLASPGAVRVRQPPARRRSR